MAFKAEKHYVGRSSILSNTVGMFASVAPYWDETSYRLNIRGFPFFHAYVMLGLVFGLIAFVSYLLEASEDTDFYVIAWLLYNSVIAGIVCLVTSFLLWC